MADAFKDRQKGYERKYELDQEMAFKVTVRRNKLLGLWAAEEMGLAGGGAETYARSVIEADFAEAGDDDVIRKVLKDLEDHDVEITDGRLRLKLEKFAEEAQRQIIAEIDAEKK